MNIAYNGRGYNVRSQSEIREYNEEESFSQLSYIVFIYCSFLTFYLKVASGNFLCEFMPFQTTFPCYNKGQIILKHIFDKSDLL